MLIFFMPFASIALVAIINLVLGYQLGCWLGWGPKSWPQEAPKGTES